MHLADETKDSVEIKVINLLNLINFDSSNCKKAHSLIEFKLMSFQISSSNNSLRSYKRFKSIDEFMQFYRDVLLDKIQLYHVPLKISTQRVSNVIQGLISYNLRIPYAFCLRKFCCKSNRNDQVYLDTLEFHLSSLSVK